MTIVKCENKNHPTDLDCFKLYNCCSCGGNECGCYYCFDCNACDACKEDE